METHDPNPLPPEQLETCLEVLQQIADDPSLINEHERMKTLIAKIHREGKKQAKRKVREEGQQADRRAVETTVRVQAERRQTPLPFATWQEFLAESTSASQAAGEAFTPDTTALAFLHWAKPCYICKQLYTQLHSFYHLLCPACAALNWEKRSQRADLSGRTALVTGGRVKIGYQVALKLLRDGATVHVTTRFPHECLLRYAAETDFAEWSKRLRIWGLDFRNAQIVEAFAQHLLDHESSLDILVNNAAQTIRRPPEFYAPQLDIERRLLGKLPERFQSLIAAPMVSPALPSQKVKHLPDSLVSFLKDEGLTHWLDADGQPPDRRETNSWSLRLHEISTTETLEVLMINAVAPFLLTARLKPLLLRSPFARRFVVNVSAMEGQFARENKTPFHPHTNMAKAALNMLTRTSAQDYARDQIYMNSVDTGWITDENPLPKREHLQETRGFFTPLDAIDGAARIYDPIVRGINEPQTPLFGHFLKDYAPHAW
jgi:NAD(P)-dependent dehydrogenase (short-subunit alcohol dehydrogenase family)